MENTTMQMIVSSTIFIFAYVLIIWDRFDRTVVALSGASLMIFFKILSQEQAFDDTDDYYLHDLSLHLLFILALFACKVVNSDLCPVYKAGFVQYG